MKGMSLGLKSQHGSALRAHSSRLILPARRSASTTTSRDTLYIPRRVNVIVVCEVGDSTEGVAHHRARMLRIEILSSSNDVFSFRLPERAPHPKIISNYGWMDGDEMWYLI
jgi:hypothetical protein